jgi:dipeptidyl-peptidase 4
MGYLANQLYKDSSNTIYAKNLKSALWLVVGELDTNIDPASIIQVVGALNKANKDYKLYFVPGGDYSSGSSTALERQKQLDFFKYHLLGESPPNRNSREL